MRRSKADTARTRARIVEIAAAAFRRDGIGNTGIAGLMDEAGLTHGGFYKHFASKEQLLAEACEQVFQSVMPQLVEQVAPLPPQRRLAAFIEIYLSPWHRDQAAQGCAFAALGSELGRQGGTVRAAADRGLACMVDIIAGMLPEAEGKPDIARAQAITATLVGAMTIARAVGDPLLSEALLANTRQSLLAQTR